MDKLYGQILSSLGVRSTCFLLLVDFRFYLGLSIVIGRCNIVFFVDWLLLD